MTGAAVLRTTTGHELTLAVDRWIADATPCEHDLLRRAVGPVVDLGCGPGRLVVALAEQGFPALGIDVSPSALGHARERGAMVLERSIFSPLPGTGRWGTAILLDGNIGIGGDPTGLLGRVAELVGPRGRLLVEVGAPGTPTESVTARVETDDATSDWFPWASVSIDALDLLAEVTGWAVSDAWETEGRWFAQLDRRTEQVLRSA